VLDELNKYAPREGQLPIKEILLDVAERGRSLGMILIGAQQTASEVERRIIANSAIRVVGRLDSAEAGRDEYGFLPTAQRSGPRSSSPGTMILSQPQLPVPLVVEFPFPSWATRASEAGLGVPARGRRTRRRRRHSADPTTRSHIPILLGSLNPASLRMAGAIADGICLNQMRVEHVPVMLDEVRAGAADAGRELPADYPVVARFFCHVTDDPEPVKAMLPHVFGAYVATPGYNRFYRWQGYEQASDAIAAAAKEGDKAAMAAAYTSDIVDDLFLIGTADEVVVRLDAFGEAGVTTAAIAPLSLDAEGAAATFRAIADARDRAA
jgi:hypothetical protein